jgi:hypothetical protein
MPDPLSGYGSLGGGKGTAAPGGQSGNWKTTPGAPTDPNGLAPQPISGSNDSLTAYFRSLSNLTGATGVNQFNQGGTTVGQGLQTVGTGLADQQTGMQTLNAPIDFYKKLLSGDPATMTQALAPTASLISQQYETAASNTSSNQAQGGFRSAAMAGIPVAKAGAVGNAALGLQSTAATQLGTLAGEQASIGQGESNTGLGVAGVGTTQQGQGLQALTATLTGILQKMGINVQGSLPNEIGAFL